MINSDTAFIILSAKPDIYTTQRIRAVAKRNSYSVDILPPWIPPDAASNSTLFSRHDLASCSIIPRISWFYLQSGLDILRTYEAKGCKSLPSSVVFESFSDKLKSFEILKQSNIPAVPTFALDQLGNLECSDLIVLKPRRGSGGVGVQLLSFDEALRSMEQKPELSETHCIQPYYPPVYPDTDSSDIRVLMCKGRNLGAIKRSVNSGLLGENGKPEFRCNVALGAGVERAVLTDFEIGITDQLALLFPNELIGVDILRTKNSDSLVLEINLCPGFEAFEKIHGLVVAEAIINAFQD